MIYMGNANDVLTVNHPFQLHSAKNLLLIIILTLQMSLRIHHCLATALVGRY